jgi:hypothetical protein
MHNKGKRVEPLSTMLPCPCPQRTPAKAHAFARKFVCNTIDTARILWHSCARIRSAIRTELMKGVAGLSAEQLSSVVDDTMRILSEHPFEFQDDDEPQFRAMLPHEVLGGGRVGAGVLAAHPHTLQVRCLRLCIVDEAKV